MSMILVQLPPVGLALSESSCHLKLLFKASEMARVRAWNF